MEAEDKRPGYSQYLVILFELCMEKTRTHLSNSWESSWRVREIHKAADILRFLHKRQEQSPEIMGDSPPKAAALSSEKSISRTSPSVYQSQ